MGIPLQAEKIENADSNHELEIESFRSQWGVLNNTDEKLTNSAHIFAPSLTEVTSGITKQIQAVPVWRDDWSFRKEEDE